MYIENKQNYQTDGCAHFHCVKKTKTVIDNRNWFSKDRELNLIMFLEIQQLTLVKCKVCNYFHYWIEFVLKQQLLKTYVDYVSDFCKI